VSLKNTLRTNADVLAIALAAFLLSAVSFTALHSGGYTSDEREYIAMGRQLASGGQFIDSNNELSTRAPLFPFVLAALFSIFGDTLPAFHVLSCLAGSAIPLLVFAMGKKLWHERTPSLIAAGAAALNPGLVIYAGLLQTETLYTLLLVAAVLVLLVLLERPSASSAAVLGLLGGCAALTRVVFTGLFPLFLLLWLWMSRDKRGAWRYVVIAFVVWCTVLAPWTLRNYNVHGTVVPVSSGGGNSLLTGNNPYATGTWRTQKGFDEWFRHEAMKRGIADVSTLSETQRSSLSWKVAFDFIVQYPGSALWLAVKKAYIFWIYPITNSDSNIPLQLLAVAADFVLLIGVAVGVVIVPAHRSLVPMVTVILFSMVVQVVLHSEARFRLPVIPFLCLFFGYGFSILLKWRADKSVVSLKAFRSATGLAGIVVIVYAMTGWLFLSNRI
jgi:4-amino-4-deoxy-L-arabinose transferase-like glycosyltransferase